MIPYGQAPDYEWRSTEFTGMGIATGYLNMGEYISGVQPIFVDYSKYNETQTFNITTGYDDQGGAKIEQIKLTWTPN